MSANVKLGGNTIENIDTVKLESADEAGTMVEFSLSQTSLLINDVNFFDYDGTIVYAYTAQEFLALTAMPANPTHQGLTSQGWNWDLVDAQAYVTKYGMLDIGQMYVTDDGKTRLYIHIPDAARSTVPLMFNNLTSSGKVVVNWGDGSSSNSYQGWASLTHNFNQKGDFVINITIPEGGEIRLGGNSNYDCVLGSTSSDFYYYSNMLRKVEFGNGCYIGSSAFYNCYNLESITIRSDLLPSSSYQLYRTFYNSKIKYITFPKTAEYISESAFGTSQYLTNISFGQNNKFISSGTYGGTFSHCYRLGRVVFPNVVNSTIGENAFNSCYNLVKIIIPENIVTIYQKSFMSCTGLKEIYIYRQTPPTLGSFAFTLQNDSIIYVPKGTLDTYKSATNWSSYATKMVEME